MSDRGHDPIDQLAALPPPAPPALSPALEAELGTLAPVAMRRPMRQLAVLFGLSLSYGAGLIAVVSVRSDAGELPIGWMIGAALGWLLGFVLPSYLALVPRDGSVTPRWQLAAIATVVASIGLICLGLMIHPSGSHSVQYNDQLLRGHACLEVGVAISIVPVVIGAIFLRGALPVGSRWIAAALGAGGGSLGGLVLHLHCHITDALHVGLMHGGVVVIAALLSAALVPRATDVR